MKKSIIIVLVILALLILGILIFSDKSNNLKEISNTEKSNLPLADSKSLEDGDYTNLQTSSDTLSSIDETLELLD